MLPPVPADIVSCFDEKVLPPPAGKPMTKGQVYDKFGEFILLDQKKTSCGKRLISRDEKLRAG